MATQQLIDIIIKATDQASSTAKKVDDQLKKLYNDVEKANTKASKSSQKFNTELIRTGESFQVVGGGAAQAANLLGQMKLDPNFGSTMDRAKLKVSQMGYDITSLGGRLRVLGTAGSTVWNGFKAKVTSAGTTLKAKLGTAIDSVRTKLKSLSTGAKGLGGIFGGLKGVFSMTAGMIGYDLVTGIVEAARASINAASQVEYFGQRLNKMSGETHLSSEKFQEFKGQLADLQKEFRKVDMTAVGATAEELAVKMNLPAEKLGDLTRMTAVMSSTFVKEGRSQEDAVLAVSDALDGQFKRLQEIGISQQMLIDNGWSGDIEDQTTLIDALNKTMADMGYEQTAKDITNLDEAWNALTISGGQLMQKVLVPLTPVIINIIEYLMKFADVVASAVSAIGGMPDWAKLAIGVAAFGLAIAGVSTAMSVGLIPTIGMLAGELALAALAALDFAIAMLANPLTWFALALAGVAVAVFEVGKAFGWWTDVGSMIDAIWAGIQRLWSAFINNPNVQGFLQDLRGAWEGITQALQPVIGWAKQAWSNLFPDNATGEVDVVRMIINVFGKLGDFLGKVVNAAKRAWSVIGGFSTVAMVVMGPAMLVVGALRSIICALLGCSPGIVPALRTVQQLFGTVFSSIAGFIPGIVSTIVNVIVSNFGKLPGKVLGFLRKVGSNIIKQGANWVKNARSKASQVVSGTVAYVKNLPGRVGGYVSSTAHRIISGASGWVTNAKNKASEVVTGVTDSISGLPGKVYNEFKAIGSKMLSAGSQLVQNARDIGKNIVSGLLDSMGIHSPGIIQTKVVKEFEDTLSLVSGNVGEAYKVGTGFGSALVDGFGEPTLGLDNGLSVYSTGTTRMELHVTHDNNYKFENLPETVSAREVANMINQAAFDDEFTKALTGNPRFQLFDAKQKQRISNRRLRSRGV